MASSEVSEVDYKETSHTETNVQLKHSEHRNKERLM